MDQDRCDAIRSSIVGAQLEITSIMSHFFPKFTESTNLKHLLWYMPLAPLLTGILPHPIGLHLDKPPFYPFPCPYLCLLAGRPHILDEALLSALSHSNQPTNLVCVYIPIYC